MTRTFTEAELIEEAKKIVADIERQVNTCPACGQRTKPAPFASDIESIATSPELLAALRAVARCAQ